MVSHSLIVSVLLSFSVAVQAGAISIDDKSIETNPVVSADINAVLHKEVGLQQGGDTGKDVMEALDNGIDCTSENCKPALAQIPTAQTLGDLLDLNRESSGFGPLVALLIIVSSTLIYASRRSPSTK